MDWAEEEFETLELGGARLNRRAVLLAEPEAWFQYPRGVQELERDHCCLPLPGQRRDQLGRCDGRALGCHEEAHRPAQCGAV